MNLNLSTRETKLTDDEFDAVERNSEGRIVDDFDLVWIWATEAQRDQMHEDDAARGEELEEELRVLHAQAVAEFA